MQTVMKADYSKIEGQNVGRSTFNRSSGHKTTFDAGYLIPFFVDEALPGDTMKLNTSVYARLSTPIFPTMDNLWMDTQFFAVPYRLIWDNFQKFCGEQVDPGDSTDYIIPIMDSDTGYAVGSLHDYIGIPPGITDLEHSSLWHRAHNLIWNEWYRDENLQDSVLVDRGDGPDLPANYVLLRRGKRHDYFCSCLPWPQKGDPVSIPLGISAPVVPNGANTLFEGQYSGTPQSLQHETAAPTHVGLESGATWINGENLLMSQSGLETDLTNATAATINQLRQSFQIQKMLEKDARGGTRYTELIRMHFDVISPDARLQRPEYLGGGSQKISIQQVAQTSESSGTPQGTMAAYGECGFSGHGFVKSFSEHCIIIGFVSVRADITYQQGLERMFSRSTRYDLYWPSLQGIGEQPVLNKEIFVKSAAHADNDLVFGYQERHNEYRNKMSRISGLYRSDAAGTLDAWHLSQDFADLPLLNSSFIQDDPPIDRVIAVPSEPHILFDSYNSLIHTRKMPRFGVPGFIDHF